MAKKAAVVEQDEQSADSSQEMDLKALIAKQQEQIEELKAMILAQNAKAEAPKAEAVETKKDIKPVTIQHIRKIRQWTINKSKVLKVHRGTGKISNPRFNKDIVLTPGCIVTVDSETANKLIRSGDFQKYGVDK